jgi:hypothetical protein
VTALPSQRTFAQRVALPVFTVFVLLFGFTASFLLCSVKDKLDGRHKEN